MDMSHNGNYGEVPLVSAVIPVYNAEGSLRQTLLSVKNQTYPRIEIIIVNDGSTDTSLTIANDFASQLTGCVVLSQHNHGVSAARNLGMKHAKGKYIAFLDSDDEWMPDKIAIQVSCMEADTELMLLATSRNDEFVSGFLSKKFEELTTISARMLLVKNFFSPPTVVLRASVVKEVGYFDESQKYAEEGNYWVRICQHHKCVFLNKSLVVTGRFKPYFGHSGLSSNLLAMEKGELKNLSVARKLGIINSLELAILQVYSVLKYIRRVIIVKIR
jgi:glycosyltransferase involved in cell wall biosynthesis